MVLTRLKMAAFAPIPSASDRMATAVKLGLFSIARIAYRRSWIRISIVLPGAGACSANFSPTSFSPTSFSPTNFGLSTQGGYLSVRRDELQFVGPRSGVSLRVERDAPEIDRRRQCIPVVERVRLVRLVTQL